jgi:hypothetical protein
VELANNDGSQECITIAQTDGFEVHHNQVHHSGPGSQGGEGIDAKDGASNGSVHHNLVHHVTRLGIYVDAWDKHSHDIDVFANVVHDCQANGYALASENGGLLENVRVFDNVAYHNKHVGLTVAGWGEKASHAMRGLAIVNNTFHANGIGPWGGGIQVDNAEASEITIRNNVLSDNLSFTIELKASATPPVVDHNLVFPFRAGKAETKGSDFVEADPRFVAVDEANFRLQADSPAIDRGSKVLAPPFDFDGKARNPDHVDVGAFEH